MACAKLCCAVGLQFGLQTLFTGTCPLLRVQWTSLIRTLTSAFDPKPTFKRVSLPPPWLPPYTEISATVAFDSFLELLRFDSGATALDGAEGGLQWDARSLGCWELQPQPRAARAP